MSFEKGNSKDGKHYWLTPLDLMDDIVREFEIDYDPCPFPLPEGFNGLKKQSGASQIMSTLRLDRTRMSVVKSLVQQHGQRNQFTNTEKEKRLFLFTQ